jgi:hypothetical protein
MRVALFAYGVLMPAAVLSWAWTCDGCGEFAPLAFFVGLGSLVSFWMAAARA